MTFLHGEMFYLTEGGINTFPLRLVGLCWDCWLVFGLMSITVYSLLIFHLPVPFTLFTIGFSNRIHNSKSVFVLHKLKFMKI